MKNIKYHDLALHTNYAINLFVNYINPIKTIKLL